MGGVFVRDLPVHVRKGDYRVSPRSSIVGVVYLVTVDLGKVSGVPGTRGPANLRRLFGSLTSNPTNLGTKSLT